MTATPTFPIRLGGELFLALRRVEGEDETGISTPRRILMQDKPLPALDC